jgi:hypothetical protein
MLSEFEAALARTALGQYDTYRFQSESDPGLARQIERYWRDLGFAFPGVGEAWSAVFVSWCVKTAGATRREFRFSARHAEFVQWAIGNAETGTGLFRAQPIESCVPATGDIIQNNRGGNSFGYGHAAEHDDYPSHSAIVVETGADASGRYAVTIGGNESDSIRRKRVALDSRGYIVQRAIEPFICVVQTLK